MTSGQEPTSSIGVTLDLTQAVKNLGCDTDLLHEIAVVFVEDVPQLIVQLEQACLQNDTPGVVRMAHSLKGLCATFGAEPARTHAQLLELNAATCERAVVRDRVQVLIGMLEQTILELRQQLSL